MRGLHVSVIALVWAAAPPLQLPIPTPDKSPWEMTFVEVEELAGLPPLATAPRDTQELRVMHRPWSAMAPCHIPQSVSGRRCSASGVLCVRGAVLSAEWTFRRQAEHPVLTPCRRAMCVSRINLSEQRDWDVFFAAEWSFCGPWEQQSLVADAAALWLRMWSDRRYREDYSSNLAPGMPAGDLYEWMAREAAAAAARW